MIVAANPKARRLGFPAEVYSESRKMSKKESQLAVRSTVIPGLVA